MKQKYNGFTLIELMVSVALMLIIIGMTMVIFNSTSTTFTVAEAKVDIMQNARLALDTIAKDIANATNITTTWTNGNRLQLRLETITKYVVTTRTNPRTSVTLTGKTHVRYNVTDSPINGLYFFQRIIEQPANFDNNTYEWVTEEANSTLAEYLVEPDGATANAPFYFEYFIHPGNSNTDWTGPLPVTTNTYPNNLNQPLNFNYELPPLVRITITVTDEFRTTCRTLSRMIWIPKGIRRTVL